MGPAGIEQRQGREGAETDWEAVTDSEAKDAVTLVQKTFTSEIYRTKAASNVEEESACMHSDSTENKEHESIGLATEKKFEEQIKTPVTFNTPTTQALQVPRCKLEPE